MRHQLFLAATLVLSACHRAPSPPDASGNTALGAQRDTTFSRLCATAPSDSLLDGTGCVLKDQARPLPVKKP